MNITEKQLRRMINEEIKRMLKEEGEAPAAPAKVTSGTKLAAKAGDATSLSGYAAAASRVMDAPGLAELIKQTIEATPVGEKDDMAKIIQALNMVKKEMA